ncbi:hypothetical protein JTB14_014195 [Gonioctena quinquepunctata]|nr:hypothetical protein JTB14_014195 [Gonioctena quinquepunctata]
MDKWLVDSKKEKRIPEPIKPSLVAVIGNGKPKANYCHDQEKPGEWGEPSTSCGTETEQTCENDFAAIPSLETKKKKIGNPKKREKKTGFVLSWINNPKFKNWLEKSSKPASRGTAFAFCKVCNLDVVAHKTVLIKHSNSEKHKLNWQKVSTSTKITELFTEKSEEIAVRNAEIKLSALLATNQLPFLLMDTLSPLLKIIFPDSKIAQKLNLKRTKATAIVCNSLGNNFLLDLHYKLREAGFFFSLIMDETTDISIKKQCAFSIIFYDNSVNQIKTNFFDLVEANGSTAVDLFDILKSSLTSKKIPLTNLVGFSSDTTNVMVGEHNSVFALLKKSCLK